MKKMLVFLLVCSLNVSIVSSQPQKQADKQNQWTGTAEQKIWSLMTIWAQTKFAFPHTERLNELNWDAKVREFIPRVLEAESMESYYKILMELVALLNDSHTYIIPPWGRLTPGYDIPPVEIQVIDDKFYIARAGNTNEIKCNRSQGIRFKNP